MTELSCRQVEQIVQAFLDGELPPHQAANVEVHLDRCRDCGIEADRIDRVRSALARLRAPLDPASLARVRRGAEEITR